MQNSRCDRCFHFRPKRRLDALVRIPTDKPSNAARDIRERDAQWEEEESQALLDLLNRGEPWPGRPRVLAYCGLREDAHEYLTYESKNAGEACPDFTPADDMPASDCERCAHRVEARGLQRDGDEIKALARMSSDLVEWRDKGDLDSGWGKIKQKMQEVSERTDDSKTNEMLRVLDFGDAMPLEPEYFDVCRRYSARGTFALCRIRNYHGRCPAYTPSRSDERTTGPTEHRRGWNDGGTF